MSQLVFVLGAGSSVDFEFPVGAELKKDIRRFCELEPDDFYGSKPKDRRLIAVFRTLSRQPFEFTEQSLFEAANIIHQGVIATPSIDNFLHIHRNNSALVAVGKAAIGTLISEYETKSKLSVDRTNIYNRLDLQSVSDSWMSAFFLSYAKPLILKISATGCRG